MEIKFSSRPDWWDKANCLGTDPGIFFPDYGSKAVYNDAKKICEGCPATKECKKQGQNEKFGFWGGERAKEIK